MFSVTFTEPKNIRSVFETVGSIVNEVMILVDEKKGMEIMSMDLSNICLVRMHIEPDYFKEGNFKVEIEPNEDPEEEEITGYNIGVNLTDVIKILKRCKTTDTLTLSYPGDNKLNIEMIPKNGKRSRAFSVNLINMEQDEIDVEGLMKQEFSNSCTIKNELVDEAIKDAEIFSKVLSLEVQNKEQIVFVADGSTGDMKYDIHKDELSSSEFTEDTTGTYAISYLKNITKASAISSEVTIWVGDARPLRMQYQLTDTSYVMFFLAPRVQEDDDMFDDDDD